MDDVGKKLLALIEDDFQALCDKDGQIQRLLDKMAKGEATMEDARQYSKRTGELLAKVYKQHITDEALPHAHMTWEIAQEAVQKTLITLYHLNTKAAMEAVKTQNEALGIHIKAQKPPLNTDRLDGIKRRLINAPIFSDVAWLLDEPVVNYSMSVVDDTVKTNADFQAKAGLGVKIIRTTTSKKPCDWCKRLAGTYDYADVNKGSHDVWKRHSHCYCRIEYVSEKDRHVVQNYRKDENKAKIADRKAVQRPDDRAPEKVEKRKEIVGAKAYPVDKMKLPPPLQHKYLAPIMRYKGGESYVINDIHRKTDSLNDMDRNMRQLINELDESLKKIPYYEGALVRTVNFLDKVNSKEMVKQFIDNFGIDDEVVFVSFTSMSKKDGYDTDAQVKIYIEHSTKSRDISRVMEEVLNMRDEEQEVLYERNTVFKTIMKAQDDKGVWHIVLEEVEENGE